jgi:hypothetical protein
MDIQTLLAAIVGSASATALVGFVSLQWLKNRATTYIDTVVVEGIKSHHAKQIEELKTELLQKTELVRGNITAEIEFRKFQLPVYKELWAALAGVKIAGSALWEKATVENLTAFREKLAVAEQAVHGAAPLMPAEDYERFGKIIEEFQKFRVGKMELFELRNYEYEGNNSQYKKDADRIVKANRKHMENYNVLLLEMQNKARSHIERPVADARILVAAERA